MGVGKHMPSSNQDQNVPGKRRKVRRVAAVAAALVAVMAASGSALGAAAVAAPARGDVHPVFPAWHVVKQVHNGAFGGFTAVTAVGRNGGWAFNQGSAPTAWQRRGSTWTQVTFPGQPNEVVVAAAATSATNV